MKPVVLGHNGNTMAWHRHPAAAILMMYRRRMLILRFLDFLFRPLVWFSRNQPAPSLAGVNNILVFGEPNLGDIVILARFFRSLRAQFPQAHVAFLGASKTDSLLRQQRLADELISIRVPWAGDTPAWGRYNPLSRIWLRFAWSLIRLRRRHFDLAFSSGRSDIRHNFVLWLIGARRRVGYGYAGGGYLLTDIVNPDLERPHFAELNLQFLRHLNIPIVKDKAVLRISEEDRLASAKLLAEIGGGSGKILVGIHPGARKVVRQWGEGRFFEVAQLVVKRFGAKILWFNGPCESPKVITDTSIIPLSLPLPQFLAVLSHCRLLICNDSGPMHMAGGVGIPVVAIFGPTLPEWFGPAGMHDGVVIRRDIWCRPCADKCVFDEPFCLRLISVEQVMNSVTKVLGSAEVTGHEL